MECFLIKNECSTRYQRESMRLLLGLNLILFFRGIWMGSPVLGFLPFLDFRVLTSKLPKPEKVTRSPFFKKELIPLIREVKAFSA